MTTWSERKTGAVLNDLKTFYDENLIRNENKRKKIAIIKQLHSV